MAPLFTEEPCLQCHHEYRIGDIRGGISITLPISPAATPIYMYVGHGFLGLFGMVGISIFWYLLFHAHRKIHRQTIVDSLTGIANRRHFSKKIAEEFSRSRRTGEPLSVLMCDVDDFKNYNDHYGHNAGDGALVRVAKEIEKSAKRPGDLTARFGGEEFVVVLPQTSGAGARKVAEEILLNMEKADIPHLSSPFGRITLSIGAATDLDKELSSSEELINQADKALYLAKKRGKNRVDMFVESMPDGTQQSQSLFE